jgi:hypothetical protein
MSDSDEFYLCLCEHCSQRLEFPKHGYGEKIECPTCHKMTVLRADPDLYFQSQYPQKADNPNGLSVFCCRECLSTSKVPNGLIGEFALCPICGDEQLFIPASQKTLTYNATLRSERGRCPNCNSHECIIRQPSKPIVFGPMTFMGQILAGVANSMADSIFTAECECIQCGHRWQRRE